MTIYSKQSNMKTLIKDIAETCGQVVALLTGWVDSRLLAAVRSHYYTGKYRGRFASFGTGSVLAYRAYGLHGIEHIAIGCDVQVEADAQLSVWNQPGDHTVRIQIGDHCLLRRGVHITAAEGITIGHHLLTGTNVLITDNAHGAFDVAQLRMPPRQRPVVSGGPVRIGDNVWLGNNVCVMPGVTIGDGAVVGANAVVTHDIPPYAMAAGVPARVIRQLHSPE